MASRHGQRKAGPQTKGPQHTDLQESYLLHGREPSPSSPLTELSHSATWWAGREEPGERVPSLREQLAERDRHTARLQEAVRHEREKCSRLQLRCNQQEAELTRRELHSNRLKERLSQFTDRTRDKGPSMELLNLLPGGRRKWDQAARLVRPNVKKEEAALRLMLERREAELREAMKLRHSLTTLLHALRVDMEQVLQDSVDSHEEALLDSQTLVELELALGDHVTGGVVQGWKKVQRRLEDLIIEGHTAMCTDQDKFSAQLQTDLEECQQLVKVQQQLLQDSAVCPVPSDLVDSYFLEDWERLQARWMELKGQRRSFKRERQSFTDAAIRLGHERRDFEQQKASLLKQQYLRDSPPFGKGAHGNHGNHGTAPNLSGMDHMILSGCRPTTPSSTESGIAALSGSCRVWAQGRVRVQTPSTPELYSVLELPYSNRITEGDPQLEIWDASARRTLHPPRPPSMDWSF